MMKPFTKTAMVGMILAIAGTPMAANAAVNAPARKGLLIEDCYFHERDRGER